MRTDRSTQERVYRSLKEHIFTGLYPLHLRIDLKAVADRYHASRTPVREAIFRLVGERLLAPHPDGGFQISLPDIARLSALYVWNAQHVVAALALLSEGALRSTLHRFRDCIVADDPMGQANQVAELFLAIGRATDNVEFAEQVGIANRRLHFPRLAEAIVFTDPARDIHALLDLPVANGLRSARQRILRYHRHRIANVDRIAGAWTFA